MGLGMIFLGAVGCLTLILAVIWSLPIISPITLFGVDTSTAIDASQAGLISALPYLMFLIVVIFTARVLDNR